MLITLVKNGEPERVTISERITGYDEELMKWTQAGHIHNWFVNNVPDAKDRSGSVRIGLHVLEELLKACEKVLFASHLVPTERFSGRSWWRSDVREAAGNPRTEIKNVSVAHKTLPATMEFGGTGKYDAAYLNAVAETHIWCAKTLADEYGRPGPTGEFYYSWGW